PKHVKEAFRLLNKSIIRVETPDINLDQDDEQQMEDQEDQDGVNEAPAGVNGLVNGISGHSEDTNKDAAPKAFLRLGFSEYRRISNLLVLHLRKAEEGKNLCIKKMADPELCRHVCLGSVLKRIHLAREFFSCEERLQKRRCLSKSTSNPFCSCLKMTFCLLQDHILIELSQSGLRGSREEETFDEDPYLVVNPNYLLED
ncbi:MCM6 factor, partial [Corythaeola cristata]|nr:MCM6 factor [Corythaeola cristata]